MTKCAELPDQTKKKKNGLTLLNIQTTRLPLCLLSVLVRHAVAVFFKQRNNFSRGFLSRAEVCDGFKRKKKGGGVKKEEASEAECYLNEA